MTSGAAFTAGGGGLLSIPGAAKPVGLLLTTASGYTIYDSGTSAYKANKEGDSAGLFVHSMNTGLGFLGLYAGTQLMKTPKIQYGPANSGPLTKDVAETFRSGTYSEVVLNKDTELYRVYGGKAGKIGSFWSRTPQNGGLQSQLDLALNPSWGNSVNQTTSIIVPKGTYIYEGAAGIQVIKDSAGNKIGELLGGGNQIYIPKVESKWLK